MVATIYMPTTGFKQRNTLYLFTEYIYGFYVYQNKGNPVLSGSEILCLLWSRKLSFKYCIDEPQD